MTAWYPSMIKTRLFLVKNNNLQHSYRDGQNSFMMMESPLFSDGKYGKV